MTKDNDGHAINKKFEEIIFALVTLTSLALIGWLLGRCQLGIEVSDEGYYLNWIAHPWLYKVSISQFGFLYHPLYQLVDGNIVGLRQINLLFTLGLAWLLCTLWLRTLFNDPIAHHNESRWRLFLIAFTLSTNILLFLNIDGWLPTPSYNTLALQACLIMGCGLLLAVNLSTDHFIGWFSIGLAGWLACMAKPTTGLLLAPIISIYLYRSGKLKASGIAITLATAVALSLISALCIDGSILGFITRLRQGLEECTLLTANHTFSSILRLDRFPVNLTEKLILIGSAGLMTGLIYCSHSAKHSRHWFILILTLSVMQSLLISGVFNIQLTPKKFHNLQILAVPVGILLAQYTLRHKAILNRTKTEYKFSQACCFAALSYAYVCGTNNNYWEQSAQAALFWILASLILLTARIETKLLWRALLSIATFAQLITITLLYCSMEYPYRQPQSLRQQQTKIQVAGTDNQLIVAHEFAEYIVTLKQLAKTHGFKTGQAMIDFTGRSPGTLYLMGAQSIAQAWTIGGYPGSAQLASVALTRLPCHAIANAWLLLEPNGPRRIATELLHVSGCGIDVVRDYIIIGAVIAPGANFPTPYLQQLLKPKRQ